jgi:hypothetical protein
MRDDYILPSSLPKLEITQLTLTFQCSWSIIIGLVVVLLACGAAWFFSPKGETQTYAHFLYHESPKAFRSCTS